MRLYRKVEANLRLSPAKLQEKTCKSSEKCKVNAVSRLAKDFLFHVCQCDLFDSHTVSSSYLSISIVNTKIKSHWFFVQDDQSDSDCCSLSHSGELRGHFSSSHSDASARNAPQKTAFLRFTEICLCLMQFKAVQSNNPSLGALTLGHKRHHNNNKRHREATTFNTCSDWLAAHRQYGWVEIWIQVGCEYGCDHSFDYGGNTVRWSWE